MTTATWMRMMACQPSGTLCVSCQHALFAGLHFWHCLRRKWIVNWLASDRNKAKRMWNGNVCLSLALGEKVLGRNCIKYLWEISFWSYGGGGGCGGRLGGQAFRPTDGCKSVVCQSDIDVFVFPAVHRQTTICNTRLTMLGTGVMRLRLSHCNLREAIFQGCGPDSQRMIYGRKVGAYLSSFCF